MTEQLNAIKEYRARVAEAVQSMVGRSLDSETLTPEELALLDSDVWAQTGSVELSGELCQRLDELFDYSNKDQVETTMRDLARWIEKIRSTQREKAEDGTTTQLEGQPPKETQMD